MSLQKHAVNTKASEFKICQNIFVFDIEKSVESEHWKVKWRRQSVLQEDDTIESYWKTTFRKRCRLLNFKFSQSISLKN
jgi:hypothetical protein